jgi:hypothetical protein
MDPNPELDRERQPWVSGSSSGSKVDPSPGGDMPISAPAFFVELGSAGSWPSSWLGSGLSGVVVMSPSSKEWLAALSTPGLYATLLPGRHRRMPLLKVPPACADNTISDAGTDLVGGRRTPRLG